MSVEIDGDMETIVRMNSSATLNVKFANQLQYGTQNELSPTWNIRYFNAVGKVIAHYEANECVSPRSRISVREWNGDAGQQTSSNGCYG